MPLDLLDLKISPCSDEQFHLVKQFIANFDLDNRDLKAEQFLVATIGSELAGFGRIREHALCSEMCSLGVIEKYRGIGVAKALTKALSDKTQKPLYLVCILPDFFTEFGFDICTTYPPELADKLHYCISELVVEEPYVVMKRR